MDYQKIYNNLCQNNRELTKEENYEFHHIIPKCLGGNDNKENLVKLSYKEHYIAHLLLLKLAKNNNELYKMSHALVMLCKSNCGNRITCSRKFEKARKYASSSTSLYMKEIIGPNGESRGEIHSRKGIDKRKDSTIYHWYHADHGEIKMDCYELSLTYDYLNGNSTNLLKVAREERKFCRGWILYKNKDIGVEGFKKLHKENMSHSAKEKYKSPYYQSSEYKSLCKRIGEKTSKSQKGFRGHFNDLGEKKMAIPGSEKSKELIKLGYKLK